MTGSLNTVHRKYTFRLDVPLSGEGISMQRGSLSREGSLSSGLCPEGGLFLEGVSVQREVSVQFFSVRRRCLLRAETLCYGGLAIKNGVEIHFF